MLPPLFPTFVLHFSNAYEDGDKIVLDGFFQHDPTARRTHRRESDHKGFEALDMNALAARAHRWTFDLSTGGCSEQPMSEMCTEFPMINGRHAGRRHRFSYNTRCVEGLFAFDAIVKHDLDAGVEELLEMPDGVFLSETAMAPRDSSTGEDDGYLVTFTMDIVNDVSECLVIDAAEPASGPIARIRLPERISSGTHSTWAAASSL